MNDSVNKNLVNKKGLTNLVKKIVSYEFRNNIPCYKIIDKKVSIQKNGWHFPKSHFQG